jgi:hypothetical protein
MAPSMASAGSVRAPGFIGLTLLVAGAVAGAASCGGEIDGELDEDLETVQSAVVTQNALTMNALTMNALTMNALTMNALTMNALTMNALTMNALTMNGLSDPLARDFLRYVVSCALDEDEVIKLTVDGVRYKFPGSLGLAPDWGRWNGSCDGDCQRWVSACVLARVSANGQPHEISIRGEHRALHPEGGELRTFRDREATYFGNLFKPGQPRFMCLSPDKTSNERVCGDSLENCPMEVVGSCSRACDDEGRHGAFSDCSDAGRANRGRVYHESITVFLPK